MSFDRRSKPLRGEVDYSDIAASGATSGDMLYHDGTGWTLKNESALSFAASQITSGTFADARIAESSVTQHEAALTIAETQITDGSILARLAANETVTGDWTFSGNTELGNVDVTGTLDILDSAGAGNTHLNYSTGANYITNRQGDATYLREWDGASNTSLAEFDSTSIDFFRPVTVSQTLDVTGALTAASYGGITEANLLDKSALETISGNWEFTGALQIDDGAGNALELSHTGTNVNAAVVGTTNYLQLLDGLGLRIFDSTDTDYALFEHDGTDFVMDFAGTADLQITGLNNNVQIRDGANLRIYDSTDSDYAAFYHDGTDFITTTFNTGDWHISGIARFTITGDTIDNPSIEVIDSSGNAASYYMTGDTYSGRLMLNGAAFQFRSESVSDVTELQLRDGIDLRIYDSGSTDSALLYHDGAGFNIDFVNTSYWNIEGITNNVILRGGTGLRTNNSGNTDHAHLAHDGLALDQTLGDKISLYGDRLDANNNYGFGVESSYTYYKSNSGHRFYCGVNADDGASETLELTPSTMSVGRHSTGGYDLVLGSDGSGQSNWLEIGKGFDVSSGIRWTRGASTDIELYVSSGEDLTLDLDPNSVLSASCDFRITHHGTTIFALNGETGDVIIHEGTVSVSDDDFSRSSRSASYHADLTGGRFLSGSFNSGSSSVMGSTQHRDGANLSYRAYWAYDCYWDENADQWEACRTTLGRKFKIDMGYHKNSINFDHFNGTVSSAWADSDWDRLLTVAPDGVYMMGDTVGHFEAFSGDYGSVQVDGGEGALSTTWRGYSIGGRMVFMDNGTTSSAFRGGLYDDVNNDWILQFSQSGAREVVIYHAGAEKFRTDSNGIRVTGDIQLDHANDTSLSRGAAGVLEVEGRPVVTQESGYSSAEITVSSSDPSGGSDGDIWLKY